MEKVKQEKQKSGSISEDDKMFVSLKTEVIRYDETMETQAI